MSWPKDNLESWLKIRQFIAKFPDTWSAWKLMVSEVVDGLDAQGMAPLFRIGQSVDRILISTLAHHKIDSEPFVFLQFLPDQGLVCVEYCVGNETKSQELVATSAATTTILPYLRRLWMETKPDTGIPDALNAS